MIIQQVSEQFEKAVASLPLTCHKSKEPYMDLIKEFGTHYTTEVTMGAKALQQVQIDKATVETSIQEGNSLKVWSSYWHTLHPLTSSCNIVLPLIRFYLHGSLQYPYRIIS